jgi:hypothetical protein
VRAGDLERLPDLTDQLTLTAVAFLEGAAGAVYRSADSAAAIDPTIPEGGS